MEYGGIGNNKAQGRQLGKDCGSTKEELSGSKASHAVGWKKNKNLLCKLGDGGDCNNSAWPTQAEIFFLKRHPTEALTQQPSSPKKDFKTLLKFLKWV